ncbi:hypothetical protein CDEST_09387 [Colletotrichum destructivum]|uniref:Uncharacterized protein n=1 Tax=Colletotrichum destructivum TaxID=34406 RepID=A0AAX4IMY9_9PEZI|nr:hypothetical protein CDEST_09387 [Colletotrichum destructivum]
MGGWGPRNLKRYRGLHRAQSTILIQMRTGFIGLNSFLYPKGMPTQLSTSFFDCPLLRNARRNLPITQWLCVRIEIRHRMSPRFRIRGLCDLLDEFPGTVSTWAIHDFELAQFVWTDRYMMDGPSTQSPNIINRESMASPSLFPSLPREIRDKIYEHYLTVPGGYVCDPDRFAASALARTEEQPDFSIVGVLKGADGQPIDLNLSYTCRPVASEMHCLALRTNTITFSTVTSDELRILALSLQRGMRPYVDGYRQEMIYHAAQALPTKIVDELKLKYPPFVLVLERMREGPTDLETMLSSQPCKGAPYGEARSLWSNFCRDVVQANLPLDTEQTAIRRYWIESDYFNTASSSEKVARAIPRLVGIVDCPLNHWSIPTDRALGAYAPRKEFDLENARTKKDRIKYRFPAAAVAILFLQSLGDRRCGQLRKIVLHED